jgi:hypothetical protein
MKMIQSICGVLEMPISCMKVFSLEDGNDVIGVIIQAEKQLYEMRNKLLLLLLPELCNVIWMLK